MKSITYWQGVNYTHIVRIYFRDTKLRISLQHIANDMLQTDAQFYPLQKSAAHPFTFFAYFLWASGINNC